MLYVILFYFSMLFEYIFLIYLKIILWFQKKILRYNII